MPGYSPKPYLRKVIMDSSLKFCARTNELNLLIEHWLLASNTLDPIPQGVIIKSERGVGKTRLALEFYRQRNWGIDQSGETGD